MRSIGVVSLLLIAACMGGQQLAPTTSPPSTTANQGGSTIGPGTTAPGDQGDPNTTEPAPATTLEPLERLEYREIAELSFPVEMTALPGAEYSYVATKDGRVWAFDGSEIVAEPVLDISGNVRNSGEQGLLSIAIHPEDANRLFVHYSDGDGDTVVSEFAFTSSTEIDPGSERALLTLSQPASNHNGGMILFGSDFRLYLGLGDGGGANDQFGNGQNLDSLLGSLVVMNVDGEPQAEIFDYGLRNPWRFWFDEGLLYVADVGQNAFEEVSVTEIAPDVNFGWPITEGLHCFRPSSGCDTTGITLPEIEVEHGDAGTCSITGGIVYRGSAIPEIRGHYFYSDYCGGYLRSFRYEGGDATDLTDWTDHVGVPGQVTGFGIDAEGEMYVTTTEQLLEVVAVRG